MGKGKPQPREIDNLVVHPDGEALNDETGNTAEELPHSDGVHKQELYRGFSGFMSFAFCFTTVSVIPSISLGFTSAISMGGPREIVWSWLIGSLFCILSGLAMAEITSVYPAAGSVYHWAGQLAPPGQRPAYRYLTGWLNLLGNMAGTTSFANGTATCISFAVGMSSSRQLSTRAQVPISIAVLAMWGLMNVVRTDKQGLVNNCAAIFQLISFLVIIGVLLALSPERASVQYVFLRTNDRTGLTDDPQKMSWETSILGITNCLYAFTGYDAGAQIAEETVNAQVSAPWGIVATVLTCAVSGFIYILGMLFATPDVTKFDNPVNDIFLFAAGPLWGFALMLLLILMYFLSGSSAFTTATRIMFAMARDGDLPYSAELSTVNSVSQVPTTCLVAVILLNGVFLMLPLVSTSALNAFTGACTVGYQLSYAIPLALRCTVARATWTPGAWNLGSFSYPVALGAAVWQIVTSFLFLWPTSYPVTIKNMNWTALVVLVVLAVAMLNWTFFLKRLGPAPKPGLPQGIPIGLRQDS